MVTTRKTIADNIAVYNVMAHHAIEFQAIFNNSHATEDEIAAVYDRYIGTISRMRYHFANRNEYLKFGLPLELNHDLIKKLISQYMEMLHLEIPANIKVYKKTALELLQIVIDETNSFIQHYQNVLQRLNDKQANIDKPASTKHPDKKSNRILLQDLQDFYKTFNKVCDLALSQYKKQSHKNAQERLSSINQLLNLSIKITKGNVLVDILDMKDLINLYIDDFITDKNKNRDFDTKTYFSRSDFFRMGLNPRFQYTFFLSSLFNLITEFQNQKIEIPMDVVNRKNPE